MSKRTAFNRAREGIVWFLVAWLAAGQWNLVSAKDTGWSFDPEARIEIGFVSAQSATRDEQLVVDGDAFTVRGQVSLDIEDDNTRFRIEADRIEVFRLGEGRSDTARDRFTVMVEQELGKDWEVQLRGRIYDDFVTAESVNTDEQQFAAQVTYEPTPAHRFRLQGTWRDREYDNGNDPETRGSGPRIDAEYRHRFDRYHYLAFDLRAESIDSDDLRRGYSRQSGKVAYTHPLTPDLRVRPALEVIATQFDNRLTRDAGLREDTLIVPEVELLWWPDKWRVEAEAKYVFSQSNQPTREREGYRLTLTVGYVF